MVPRLFSRQTDEVTCFAEQIIELLPHGSGFDSDYCYRFQKNGKLVISSDFHCLNDNGYYDGFLPFSITIDVRDILDFRLTFHNWQSYTTRKYAPLLGEYIGDTIYHSLDCF